MHPGLVYRICDCQDVQIDSRTSKRMMMLQLPFAVDSTYSGPWCDRHELWQKHADVKARLHPSPWPAKSDGTFWIEFEDALQSFDQFFAVPRKPGSEVG